MEDAIGSRLCLNPHHLILGVKFAHDGGARGGEFATGQTRDFGDIGGIVFTLLIGTASLFLFRRAVFEFPKKDG